MGKLLNKFSLLNAAEASVISFLIISLIGGTLLYFTEMHREVKAKVPALEMVMVAPVNNPSAGVIQEHVLTKDAEYRGETYIDSLFTAVSALCVTGLTSTDFSRFTPMGQFIVMLLIQMGGLGIIVFTSILAFNLIRGLSERTPFHSLLANVLDTDHDNVRRMLKHVLTYTFAFELIATLIMGFHLTYFVPASMYGNMNVWWWSLFHSVSAFNNAGFGLMSNNLMNFAYDPVITLTISSLIILGGLGYPVLIAIHVAFRKRISSKKTEKQKLLEADMKGVVASSLQTKVAIYGTIALLALGTFVPMLIETGNPVLGHTFGERLLSAFFQSVSTRTAGFNTVDVGALRIGTIFLYIMLMFIGANPAGTAGGIKIPTLGVLLGYIKDWFSAPNQPVTIFKKRISKFAVSHAIRLLFFSVIFISTVTFVICIIEAKYLATADPTFNFIKILFEIVSAFGTVGMTMGFAGGSASFAAILAPASKLLLVATMLFGRLGPLTILAALPWKRRYANAPLSPDFEDTEKIQIG